MADMSEKTGSNTLTNGIRVIAEPHYVAERSSPDQNYYFYSYHITITNESERSAKLLTRHWIIINSHGDQEEVRGPGVIGKQPDLAPGESFEYTSFCPLDTNFGTMEGTYRMIDRNGTEFDIEIGRFYLVAQMSEIESET